jgi:RNAse (barnase) inhibitor barstar
MERPEKLLLDMSGIIDDETLHEYLSKKLNFPGYYGYNFDAFWDCITDEEQSSMPNVLVVEGLASLKMLLPKEYEKLFACLKDYEIEYPDRIVIYEENSPSGEGIEFED